MAEHAEGAPCWADATLPDLAAGRRFYGELFGWTFPEYAPETTAEDDTGPAGADADDADAAAGGDADADAESGADAESAPGDDDGPDTAPGEGDAPTTGGAPAPATGPTAEEPPEPAAVESPEPTTEEPPGPVTEQPPEPPQPPEPEQSSEPEPAPARTVPEPAARGAAGNDGGHLWTPALLDGELAAGLRQKSDGRMPTVWTVYLATDDIRRTTERARAAGGQVITDPVLVGGGPAGVLATVADPSGAVFNLWQPVEHSGFGVTGRPGGYVWTEVHTRDKEAVDAFYREVFGYETRVLDSGGADFLMWAPRGEPADEQHAVGGRSLIDASQPAELPAHFLTYFTVADCDEAARTVTRLGGRVLSEPETGEHGRFAVLVDNQGAVFAVLDPESAVSRG